jgi:hypothetical protein
MFNEPNRTHERNPEQRVASRGDLAGATTRGRAIVLVVVIISVLLGGPVAVVPVPAQPVGVDPPPFPTPTRVLVNPIALEVQADSGTAGEEVECRVVLHTRGQAVAGVQVDLEADAALHFATQALGEPQCQANPAIGKTDTGFHLFPSERRTLALRAVVLSFTDLAPIADGSVLFSCRLHIGTGTPPGIYDLTPTNLLGSTPRGERIDAVGGTGHVVVREAPTGTPHAQGGADNDGDGGCQINGEAARGGALPVLLPATLLAGYGRWRRHRRRT